MTVLSTKPDEHSTVPGSDNEKVRYHHIKAPFSHNEKPWVESKAQRNANLLTNRECSSETSSGG